MTLLLGVIVIGLAVYAIVRKVDVRLALFLAALALGALAGQPEVIVRKFLVTLVNEQFVVPICTAMGFAYVLRHTGCDRHLVRLLVEPLRRVRPLLIPGAVVVCFLINIPVISQASTAVMVGAVLIPLLLAARVPPVTVGAALLLGSSIGGELLNPGAPELRTVVSETANATRALEVTRWQTQLGGLLAASASGPLHALPWLHLPPEGTTGPGPGAAPLSGADCVSRIMPLIVIHLAVATALFWVLSLRAEKRRPAEPEPGVPPEANGPGDPGAPFRVSLFRAAVPLVPLLLLVAAAVAFRWKGTPYEWLLENPASEAERLRFESRLIGAAMLAGVAVAALTVWRAPSGVAVAFFDGAGYAFTNIISIIVAASCFGDGVKLIGLDAVLGELIRKAPALLLPLAGGVSLGFAALCGSGMAATQSLFGFFASPALEHGTDPGRVGAVVSIAAAAGRTMSPVAAVVLLCSTLTKTNPLDLIRRVALPLLAGVAVMVTAAVLLTAAGW
jgi:C4-dicarboxylate transporter, DcuC family